MAAFQRRSWLLAASTVVLGIGSTAWSAEPSPEPKPAPATTELKALQAIAAGIERLKKDYPQLEEFQAAKQLLPGTLAIDYAYKTHAPEHSGGWTSGVPNPDPDGLWFYVDVHDPDSTRQIHTQPVTAPLCLGKKRVTFLILEGAKTKSAAAAIGAVLQKSGVTDCKGP
ncbi:MAG: hypothetical protein QM765_53565 [Myxococcales bacterium]